MTSSLLSPSAINPNYKSGLIQIWSTSNSPHQLFSLSTRYSTSVWGNWKLHCWKLNWHYHHSSQNSDQKQSHGDQNSSSTQAPPSFIRNLWRTQIIGNCLWTEGTEKECCCSPIKSLKTGKTEWPAFGTIVSSREDGKKEGKNGRGEEWKNIEPLWRKPEKDEKTRREIGRSWRINRKNKSIPRHPEKERNRRNGISKSDFRYVWSFT